jgi:putative transposase
VLQRLVELAQYTSIAFTEELREAGITGSIGSVGDALDNALMESTIGLFKAEVIWHERTTWDSWRQIEDATASWVTWYNHERLHSAIGNIPPAEYETNYDSTRGHDRPAAA